VARQDLDVSAIMAQLDEEFSDTPQEQVANEEATEPETQVQDEPTEDFEEAEEEFEEAEEDFEEEVEDNEPSVLDANVHKRNDAFKRLREERDQLAKSDEFLTNLSAQYGISKEELINRYQNELDQKRAQETGMTPEQFKKMKELEKKVQEIEETKNRELFNIKANQIANKYTLKDNDMMNLFTQARNLNLDILSNPDLLEFVYRSVNYEQALERGRQAQLETTKKRSATSTGKTGTAGKQFNTNDEDMQSEIDAFLKEQGILKEK